MNTVDKAPGVYFEEITPAGAIAGVGTSTAAFIGFVEKKLPEEDWYQPKKITNWTQYTEYFDEYAKPEDKKYLPYAVRGFFDNGGTVAYILPLGDKSPKPDKVAAAAKALNAAAAAEAIKVAATAAAAAANKALIAATTEAEKANNVAKFAAAAAAAADADAGADAGAKAAAEALKAAADADAKAAAEALKAATDAKTDADAKVTVATAAASNAKQAADTATAAATAAEAAGAEAAKTAEPSINQIEKAIEQLKRLFDVSIVCAPGIVDPGLQAKLIEHCEIMRDRFAILDGNPDQNPIKNDGPLQQQRGNLTSKSGFAGLYWPWIKIINPSDNKAMIDLPPSGHIAGIFSRSDGQYGVHKAPANEFVRGAVDLTYPLNGEEHGQLNSNNINALRLFPNQPPTVYGARTTSDGTPWRYVNVRRLFSYVESSILQGIRWAVFKPNNTTLWKQLERTITEFLTRVWQSGALFGNTAKEAFYVRIDDELNPSTTRELGEVHIEIGMAPVRPAEFIIIRIGMWEGGSQVIE